MADSFRFDNRVVLVTGAGAGLGRSYALEFARRGASVVVNDLGGGADGNGKSRRAADQVVAEIQALGGQAVASYDSVEQGDAIVQTAIDNFDRIDVLVNNAGILRDSSFAKMTEQDWELIYRVHTLGTYRVTKAAWAYMQQQRYGRIVNTCSAAGLYGNFGQANYACAKMGLYGLTRTLAEEGAKKNISVNIITPLAGSRLTETILPAELVAALRPEFVTPLVIKLCCEQNTESGSLFELGAGWIAKLRWQRSRGVAFAIDQPVSAEMVAQHWDEISDFSEAEYPQAFGDSIEQVYNKLGIDR